MGETEKGQTSANPARNARELTLNAIHERAYRKWQAAGRPEGNCLSFWLEAEQELLQGK
jgi:hypothetical protein